MASIKELYDASMKHGLLNSKVDEQAFVDMLGNNRLRQQYYRYVNEKIPGAFSTNYDEFSKNIDNGLADYASAPKGVNPPVIGDENQKEQALQEIAPGVPMQQTPAQPQAPQQSMAGKIAGKAMSAVGNAAQFISSPQAYIAKQFVKNDYKMGKALYDEMQYEATDAERQQWDEQEKPVADLINTAAEDVNRHFKQMADERAQRYNASANAFIPQAAQGAMGMDSTQSQENKNYTAANELLQQAAVRLQGTHKGDANFLTMGKEFLKQGATKMTNLFSNGITDVMVEKTAADLINKADDLGVFDGEVAAEDVLSQDEITLLNAVVAKAGAEFARKDNTSMLTAAGTQTADMLPFMRDIALGKGIFGGLTESAQKGIFRLILSNVGNGNGARFAANASKMALGLAESGAIASALPTTYANAFKGTGNLDGRVSVQDGEIFIDGANTEGIGKAVADAWADQTQELFTETGGNFKLMGRAFADTGIGRALGSTKLKNLQNKFAKTAFGKFAKGVAFDGVAGEWLEEVEGNFYDVMGALIHPQQEGHGVEEAGHAWDAFWNMETQVPMLLSFSVPALGGHAINGAQYAYHATQVNSAKKSLGELLRGYGYDNADIDDSIRNIRMVTAASTPNDLAKNISELATTFVDQSQIREYNKANRQLQQLESKETLNAEQQKRVDQLKNDLANNQVTKFISAATQYAVADANMGAIYAGHQEEIRDLRDEYKITQDVQSHTNSTDNNVYHLADNDGNEVGYVTNGKISVDNEGNISLGQSDSRVLVTNPMTGVSSYMPLAGLRVDAPVMSADEEISARVSQEKARKQGMATFRPGQRVNVKTPDGQVVPDANPSEVVGVTDNGVQVTTENPDGTIGVAEVPHEQAVEGLEPVEEGGMNITLDLEEGQGNGAETLDVIDNATNKPISLVKLENEGGYIDPIAATLYSEEDVKARIADGTWKEAAQGENGNASAQVSTQQKKTAPAQENAPSALQNQNNLVSLQRAGGERVWADQLQEALDKECPLPCEVATKEDIISGAVQFPQSMMDAVSDDSLVQAYVTGGRVYVVSDHITNGAMADAVILQHECLHDYIKNNANAHYGMQAFARNHSREDLLGMLSLTNADVAFYSRRYKADTPKNREALADEVIANASQYAAENGMEPETMLKMLGLNPLEVSLINTIINGNKQQIAEYGSASRRGQNDDSPVEGEGLASVRSVLPEAGSRAGGMGRQGDRPVELMQPAVQGAEQVTEEQVEEPRGSLKGDADVANAVAYKSGAEIETEDGSEGGRFSTAANFEGAGFVCRDAADNPLVDAEGNVYVTMGGRKFDANHPITADDIAANERSPLNLMLADAKAIANVDIAEDIHHKYADLLNMYLEKGSKEKGGWDNINGENAKWRWLGDTVYKTVAKNGDSQYSYSIDITRVCKKNEAVINTISEVQRRYGYGITPSQIMDIYLKTDQNGYQVPCPVCYVFSRYIRNGKYATAAINGMLKYGKHLPGGNKKDVWTAQQWYEELQRVQEMQNNPIVKKALEGANEDVVKIEGMIDAIGEEILRGRQNKTLTQERETELMKQIQQLDARYRAALQVISQQSLSNWIKMFAIKANPKAKANYYEVVTVIDTDNDGNEIPEEKRVEKKVKYVLRDDAKMPTDIEDFKNNALDFGLTANVIQNYPGIMRLRKSGGSAAGKTITFVSNNDLGDIIQGVSTNNPESIKKAEEFYTKAVNAKTDEERIEMLNRAAYERKNNYQKAAEAKTEKEFKKYKDAATANFKTAYLYAQRQSLRGGQRMWSWSDNIESLSPDVVVNLMQMSMLGGALQSYSKQLEGINLVASMDGYVNGSLMGYGLGYQELNENEVGKDENGNLIYTGEDIVVKDRKGTHIRTQKGAPVYQTADGKYITLVFDDVVGVQAFGQDGKEGLFDLNKRLDKAGNILVGMDDNHVLAAMADNRVFFIIPWHASGQSNHILAQMYDYLGVQLVQNGHGATDFTKVQEEKSMFKVTGKAHKNLMAFYDAHNFESIYPCAFHIDHNGESGIISEDQRRYKELRDAIFDGISNLTPEQLDLIEKDEFLSQVVRKMDQRGLDSMTDGDKNYIYPYEYWDEESTEEDADVNGARYVEYCRRLGKKPKFCGMLGEGKAGAKDFGNFVGGMLPDGTMFGHKGYWKLLIDRRMYDVDGDFQDLGQTDASGFYPKMVDPKWTEKHFKVTLVANAEGVQKIADDVTNLEKTRHMGKAPMVDYGLDILGAAQEYLRITGEDFDPNDGGGNGGGIKPKKNETSYTYAKRLATARNKSAAVSDSADEGVFAVAARPGMRGIQISDKDADYTGMILRGEKTEETRISKLPKTIEPGAEIAIIRAGVGGKQMVVGYAKIGEPIEYKSYEEFHTPKAEARHHVEKGSEYDMKEGQIKYGYPLTDVTPEPNPYEVSSVHAGTYVADEEGRFATATSEAQAVEYYDQVEQPTDEGNIIPLDQRFSNESSDVRFAVYGKKGASELDFANEQTYRMDNLDVARRMEKEGDKDARTIKAATGWERGVDGLWRYEMPDGRFIKDVDVESAETLKDVWNDPALFKAYPFIADINVTLTDNWDDNFGWYSPKENKILLGTTNRNNLRGALIHEIQHAIQDYEGFAQGGIPFDFREEGKALGLTGKDLEDYENEGYRKLAGEVEARNVQQRRSISIAKRRESLLSDTEDVDSNSQIIRNADDSDFARFAVANKNQEIFVSNAAQAVTRIKQEKATPQQWLAMLTKEGGIKAGEDKWMGLTDWLKDSAAKTITKDEVMQFINENAIKIEDVKYVSGFSAAAGFAWEEAKKRFGDKVDEAYSMEYDDYTDTVYPNIINYTLAARLYNEYYNRSIPEDASEMTTEQAGELESFGEEIRDIMVDAYEMGKQEKEINETRINYTTNGLDNKREIALVVPTIEPWNKNDNIHFGDAGQGRAIGWIRFGETRTGMNKRGKQEESRRIADYLEGKYGSAYYNEDVIKMTPEDAALYEKGNELYRSAINDDNVESGERVLVIDEIQSKRHQEGRDKGYAQETKSEHDAKVAEASNKYETFIADMEEKYGSVALYQENGTDDELNKEKELSDAFNAVYNKELGIPDAPFDKNWMELCFKRMLRLAAEEGYDRVAWTSGKQQAKRYSLSMVLKEIEPWGKRDGVVFMKLRKTDGSGILIGVDENGIVTESSDNRLITKGDKLSDLLGKDLAVRAMTAEDPIRGEDLEVGGEGMKSFYDQMLPSFVRKYTKKWGATVEDVTLPNVEEAGRVMHSVNITPEMKESVMEGQGMFSVASSKQWADEHRLKTEHIQPGENLGMFATRLTRDEAIRSYMDVMTDAQSEMTKRARQLYQMVADNAAPIERFQEWVFKNGEIGKDSRYDAYSDVFLASGRVTRATELFHRDIVNPLAEYMKGIINDGTLDNIGIDTPDGGKADIVWHDVKNERNGEKLTARELIGVYAQAKDIVEAQQLVRPNRGYEGFVEIIGFEPKQIIKAVEDALGEERTNELWNRIRKTTKFALDYERRGGYIDQETYDMYQDRMFYVPQRGWRKRDMGNDADSYISGGGSLYNHPYNAVLIKAKGRESLAGDPFAYIISIGESAIISTENNKIKQKFLALCRANEDLGMKSGAFTVEQKWVANVIGADGKVLKQDGSPVVRLMDGRPDKDTIEHDNEIKAKIKTLQKALNMSTKAGTRAVLQTAIDNLRDELIIAPNKSVDFLVERTDAEKQQHSVIVLVDGQKVVIHLQDAELANAINNNFEKNQQGLLDIAFLDKPRRATRALSAALTQYNPEFAARNFWRDSQVALMTILAENKELAPDAIKNLVLAQRAIGSFVADEKFRDKESEDRSMKSGVFKTITKKDDEGNDIEVKEEMTYKELLNEYFDSGAATGYSFLKELNQQQQDFDKLLKDHKFEKAGKCIFGALSFLTEMSETSVRFAAYAAARQHGWDIDRAAIMSKELTTNFDRAGSSTNSPLFSWFSFTKATINGNLKFFKAFKKAPWAYASIAAAYMMIGFLQVMLEPDDPEKERNISSFTRGSNLIIGKWKIPCAHFLRIFHSWGVETALAIRGDKRYASALADAVNTTTGEIIPSQFNLLNHWGEGDDWYKDYLQGAAPTAVSPFVDIRLNRNFMGAPVNREYYSIKETDKKDIFFSRKSTPEAWNKIAEGVYKYIGGGNMKSKYKGDDNAWAARFDFSGSTLEHIVMGYSPAIAETLFNTATMVMKACDPNEELKATDVTFLRDVRRTYDAEKDYKGEYYDLKNRYDKYKDLLADYKKNDRDSYRKERNSDKYKLYKEIERSRAIKKKPEDGATYTPEQINKLREFNKKWNRI